MSIFPKKRPNDDTWVQGEQNDVGFAGQHSSILEVRVRSRLNRGFSSVFNSVLIALVGGITLFQTQSLAQTVSPASTSATTTSSSASISPQHNQPEVVSHETTTFKVRVNQVLLRVVVRDKQGNAVGNLPREAFEVLDNGKPQPITSFSLTGSGAGESAGARKVAEEPSKVAEPQRYVAYVFDDLHVEVSDLARAKDAASRYLTSSMTSADRAAIFTISGRVALDFTDNPEQLLQTIAKIKTVSLMRDDLDKCPRMNYYLADQIMNVHNVKLEDLLVDDTIKCLNLLPNATAAAERIVRSTASRVLSTGDADVRMSFSVLRDIIMRLSSVPGQRSLMLVSPGFFIPNDLTAQLTPLFERALHANVVIDSLDVRGMWMDPDMSAQSDRKPVYDEPLMQQYLHAATLSQNDVLAELSNATGGTFVENTNDLLEGLRRSSAPPEFSYLLSFTPQNLKADGKFHNLKVVVSNPPGLTARTQKGYFAPRRTQDAAEQTKSDIEDAVFSRDERQDIPVDLHTEFFKSATDQANVAVLTHVDLRHLTFRKEAERNLDTVTVVSVLFDRNGRFVSGQEKTIEFHMRDDSMQRHLQNGIAIKSSFDVKPGDYLVRVVVRDTEGQMLSARNDTVSIP
jgi:VWFA-related protein